MSALLGIKAVHALATPGKSVAECAAQQSLISVDVGGVAGPVLDARLIELTGKRFRKLGRFMQLALTGAVEAAAKSKLTLPPTRTGVFLATGLGNISDLMTFSHAVFGDPGYPLSAIQFANSVGNAGAFYIAQTLGLTGPVLAVSQDEVSFEAALLQAVTLIEAGDLEFALVGAVDVAMPNVKDHLARMGIAPDAPLNISEGSAWWVVGRSAADDFATLEAVSLETVSLEAGSLEGAAGVSGTRDFDIGMHYARSGVMPTLFLGAARAGETYETTARTREGLTAKTRVRRGTS